MNKKLISCCILSFLLVPALSGCPGEDENNDNGGVIITDPDAGTADADGGELDPCLDVVCESGFSCVEGTCESNVDEGYGCANPFDLGVLSGTEIREYQANPAGQPNLLNTTCSEDDHSAQAVYKFQVEEPIRMTL